MSIGDKVLITNLESLTKEDIKILRNANFICTVEDIDTYPTNTGTIDIIYTEELKGCSFTSDDYTIN